MNAIIGTVFDIKKYAIHDGPGIRTTVFFQGCPLACWWCHNPESQSPRPALLYRANRCVGCGTCVDACPQHAIELSPTPNGSGAGDREIIALTNRDRCDVCGRCADVCYHGARIVSGKKMTVAEIIFEIERDLPFYDQSGGGVSFSGGEPLLQGKFLAALLRECRQREIDTVVDTSGFAPWDLIDSLLGDIDLFLYDLKLIDDDRHQEYTGVSNKLILRNLQRLAENGARVEIRIPLIPGINDDVENLAGSADFISGLPNITAVELMPYHEIAAAKYESLRIPYLLPGTIPPSDSALQKAARYFNNKGLSVKFPRSGVGPGPHQL